MESIAQRVARIVSAELGLDPSKVKPDSSFCDDLGADELDGLEIIMALEDEFGISITDQTVAHEGAARNFATVGNAISHIETALALNKAA